MRKIEKFCALTVTRGDRPRLLDHCRMQMQRQTVQPGDHFIIDYTPRSAEIDLVERVRIGLDLAAGNGYDIVYFIEDDDYYQDDYFERIHKNGMAIGKSDIIGIPFTWYYHLLTRSYIRFDHPDRASMFCTGLRISEFRDFPWPEQNKVYLDIDLWKHLAKQKFVLEMFPFPIGIKHCMGLCAGNGHERNFPFTCSDPEYAWLKANVRPISFEFYMSLK